MTVLTISDVSRLTGLAPSALRYYERCGLIASAGRASGKRVYDPAMVQQVALVDLLKIAGFTLSEIAQLIDLSGRVSSDWRSRAVAKQHELRHQLGHIERALTMLQHTIDCPHDSLHECPVHRAVVTAHASSLTASTESADDDSTV